MDMMEKELHSFFQHLCFKIIAVTLALLLHVCMFALAATVEVFGKSSYKGKLVLQPFSDPNYSFQVGSNLFKSTFEFPFLFKTWGKTWKNNYQQNISLVLPFLEPSCFIAIVHSPAVHCCPSKPQVSNGKTRIWAVHF